MTYQRMKLRHCRTRMQTGTAFTTRLSAGLTLKRAEDRIAELTDLMERPEDDTPLLENPSQMGLR